MTMLITAVTDDDETEEFRNVYLLMTWIWLSWGDPVWLTGHQNPVTTIHHHNNNKNSFTARSFSAHHLWYPGLQCTLQWYIQVSWTKTTQSQFNQLYLPTQYRAVPDPYAHHILDCSGVRDLGWVTGGGGAGVLLSGPVSAAHRDPCQPGCDHVMDLRRPTNRRASTCRRLLAFPVIRAGPNREPDERRKGELAERVA